MGIALLGGQNLIIAGQTRIPAAVGIVVQFAPQNVRNQMEANGYTWVQGTEDMTGYFKTQNITRFDSMVLEGQANTTYGSYFCRVQSYESKEQEKANIMDMMVVRHDYVANTPFISLQTKRAMMYSNGSLKISGKPCAGFFSWDTEKKRCRIRMRLGVGMTRQTAQWWYMDDMVNPDQSTGFAINSGWRNTVQEFSAYIINGQIYTTGVALFGLVYPFLTFGYPYIPMPADAYGYLFIDILGMWDGPIPDYVSDFEIGDLSIEFNRDQTTIPTSFIEVRPRTIVKERQETAEYKSSNTNQTEQEWSADCIFASDNNMVYGYGLLINSDGTFMKKAQYNGVANAEYPEQHLANCVASYWSVSRRRMGVELRANTRTTNSTLISSITPRYMLTIDGTKMHPVAISREWRDDVVILSMLEMP